MAYKWRKIGNIFNPRTISGRPWLKEFAQAPSVLLFDDRVRVYFSCRPPPDANGQYVSYSAYVDLDRKDISRILAVSEQPILSLGRTGTFDEFGTYPVSVIRHKDTVRAYYGGWSRCESVPFDVAIGCAVSTDEGVTFSKIGSGGPILSAGVDEPFVISGPKIRRFNGAWQLFYIAGRKWILADGRPEPVYRIRMATSTDGFVWKRSNRDLIPIRLDDDEAQASPDVLFHNGTYHMFFCYRRGRNYRGREGGYRIGYASSPDMKEWQRDDSRAGIDVSAEGWDSEMVSYPHVFAMDGQIYMLHLGNAVGREGFGAAILEGEL
ncbi:MAG: glycosylase [Planctomycetota bacterium]